MSTTVLVYTVSARKGKWSRYLLPYDVNAFAQLEDDLYIHAGDTIQRVSESAVLDDIGGTDTAFDGLVQWGYLDCGQPGQTKELEGVDIVATGTPSVAIGWDQRNLAAFTTDYQVPADTLPGDIIPLFLAAPTLSVRVSFAGGEPWKLDAVNLYLSGEQRSTT